MDLSGLDIEIEGSQSGIITTKNKVDIVFVIDNSGTMSGVIDGVKKHITTFVSSLENNSNNRIDYRIGFVFQGAVYMLIKNFTTSVSEFIEAIERTKEYAVDQNELGLLGLDIAADFEWEDKRHKFIIIFTDEDVSGGIEADYQLSKYEQLLSKLESLRIKIYYFGVDGDDYRKLKKVPGTYYEPNETFENVNFSELLNKIGKSVSQAAGVGLQSGSNNVKKDLYDVKSYVDVINL